MQADAYYTAAKDANLQIAPLLLYYGSTNLLYGMINLLSGKINKIENHGMNIIVPDKPEFIADVGLKFLSPQTGGVHVIARALNFDINLTALGEWKLRDFLDSIAEISQDYVQCYEVETSCIVMLDVFNTPDGKVEKVYYSRENRQSIIDLMNNIPGFAKAYLPIRSVNLPEKGTEYFILRHKLNGTDISDLSYSGQPYLRAGHKKNGQVVTLPTILNMYVSLFILASLCRYYPERWSPFVLNDTTGEKLLIEKFLYYARRMIPNIVLNELEGECVKYTSNRYEETDTIKLVGEHQVQEMVEKIVRLQSEKRHIVKNALSE